MVERARGLAWKVGVVAILAGFIGLPASEAPAPSSTGTLEGNVTIGPRLAAHRMKFSLYADPQRAAPPPGSKDTSGELENVVVYVEAAPPGAAPPRPPTGPFRIEQEGLSFKPHVLAVVKGATVEFPNRDTLFHNVFSLSKAASFDLGRYPKDGSKSVRFDTPGIVPVFCHIHSDMSAVIVVLDNPFFTSPDSEGRFEIDGIPPGTYRVVAWHERARRTTKTIRVEPGEATVLNFEIPLTDDANGG